MNKKQKTLLTIIVIILAIAVIGFIILNIQNKSDKITPVTSFVYNEETDIVSRHFNSPDYEADIFEDEDYLGVTSWINYTRGSVTIGLYDEDYEAYDKNLVLFDKYFDALKTGDLDTFLSLHSDRYFENNWKWLTLAPQRIYDIYVEYIFDADVNDPEYGQVTKHVYKVSYKIMKNDGTFRNDVGSDASKPVYLEIVEESNGNVFFDACGNSFKYPEN